MQRFILFLFVLSTVYAHAQDMITLRDSSVIKASVNEITQTDVKYRFFDYADGPLIIKPKTEIAYITYKNGTREVFQVNLPAPNPDIETLINPSHSVPAKQKTPNCPSLAIEAGMVLNESYSCKPFADKEPSAGGHGYSGPYESFYFPGKKYVTGGFNLGINLATGRSPYCKFLFGLTYIRTNAEFNYTYSANSYYDDVYYYGYPRLKEQYGKDVNYKITAHFLNINAGVRFTVFKRLHIDNLIALNTPLYATNKANGYESLREYYQDPATGLYTSRVTNTTIKNEISHKKYTGVTASFIPKLSYDFYIGQQKLGVYAAYNISVAYKLQWYMFGLSWYPFKKLV